MKRLSVCVFLLCTLTVSVIQAKDSNSAAGYFSRAAERFAKGDVDGAIRTLFLYSGR